MKTKILLIAILSSLTLACFRLDSNLFNPSTDISEYKLDNYTGEVDFILPESYNIPDSLIDIFTIDVKSSDGDHKIYAIYVGNQSQIATDTVIMYCHGNKDHMDFYWQRQKLLANIGKKNRFGVLMIDYAGYGLSEGKPTETKMYDDVNAALSWLKTKGLSGDRLIMYGFSMGTAPATKFCAEPSILTPKKLILENPFASAEVMVQDASVLAIPGSFFTNLSIDNAEKIKQVSQEFLWIYGTKDVFLNPTTHGQIIFDNYSGVYKQKNPVENAGHDGVPQTMGFEKYCTTMEQFITR